MRFHILGIPHTATNEDFGVCAFTQKVFKFGKMMKNRGHHIIHYGHEDSTVECDEHVTVVTNKEWKEAYGDYNWRENGFKYNLGDTAYTTFFANAIKEIGLRKQKNDFILAFWGNGHKDICAAHPDLIAVEPGIGYAAGLWANWKVFESYSIMHAFYGMEHVTYGKPEWYSIVIPNYFDTNDFEFHEEKEDYFLYLGRVTQTKGVHIAIQTAEAANKHLIIAGTLMDGFKLPNHVEYVGYANHNLRKQLMAKAKGIFMPTMYTEPFGGVMIEAFMSGTPAITTDWGTFAENNLHGITGYRCRTFDQFVWATEHIDNISNKNCRIWAENFTFDKIAPQYEEYFNNVLNVYNGKGWYERNYYRDNLNFLKKDYDLLGQAHVEI